MRFAERGRVLHHNYNYQCVLAGTGAFGPRPA